MPVATVAAVRKQIGAGETDPVYLLLGEDEVEKSAVAHEFEELVEEGVPLVAAVAQAETDHHFGKPHDAQTNAALLALLRGILLEEVGRGVDDVIEEADGVADGFAQGFPFDLTVLDESREVDRAEVTDPGKPCNRPPRGCVSFSRP